jgi:hypothetical protein
LAAQGTVIAALPAADDLSGDPQVAKALLLVDRTFGVGMGAAWSATVADVSIAADRLCTLPRSLTMLGSAMLGIFVLDAALWQAASLSIDGEQLGQRAGIADDHHPERSCPELGHAPMAVGDLVEDRCRIGGDPAQQAHLFAQRRAGQLRGGGHHVTSARRRSSRQIGTRDSGAAGFVHDDGSGQGRVT